MNKLLAVTATAFLVCGGLALAQESSWDVPAEATAEKNPLENTPENVQAGAALFEKHCKMCHGDSGKGDGAATQFIKPAPHDFTTAAVRDANTDGDLFYKITTGKRPMPPMARKMSDDERWQVVLFVRSLQAN